MQVFRSNYLEESDILPTHNTDIKPCVLKQNTQTYNMTEHRTNGIDMKSKYIF